MRAMVVDSGRPELAIRTQAIPPRSIQRVLVP